jgi:tetratricopeptide (TPR) repeat protein
MTRKEREILLSKYSELGVEALLDKGATWFYHTFLPNLTIATETNSVEDGVLADCWFAVGDLYDLVFAPLHAKEAYEKAIEIDPDFGAAYAELASIYSDLGDYVAALEYIEQAIELDADDVDFKFELQNIQQFIKDKVPTVFSESNEKWPYYEALAAKKWDYLLENSNDEKNAFHSKMKAFTNQLTGNRPESAKNWEAFLSKSPSHEQNFVEEFYMK